MARGKIRKDRQMNRYSFDEVFKKASKSPEFQKAYNEEIVRLKLAKQIREIRLKKKRLLQAPVTGGD